MYAWMHLLANMFKVVDHCFTKLSSYCILCTLFSLLNCLFQNSSSSNGSLAQSIFVMTVNATMCFIFQTLGNTDCSLNYPNICPDQVPHCLSCFLSTWSVPSHLSTQLILPESFLDSTNPERKDNSDFSLFRVLKVYPEKKFGGYVQNVH